jgi:hypothetical protein
MSSAKYLFLIVVIIGMISLGCVGKKPAERVTATPPQPTVTPTQTVVPPAGTTLDKDLNTMENDINNLDGTFSDSNESDSIELGISESSFT